MSTILILTGTVYWLCGNNQIIYYGVDREEIDYNSFPKAMWFVYNLLFGLSGTESFFKSGGLTQAMLFWNYMIMQFVMNITLMNMLIAIMGETFSNQSEKKA